MRRFYSSLAAIILVASFSTIASAQSKTDSEMKMLVSPKQNVGLNQKNTQQLNTTNLAISKAMSRQEFSSARSKASVEMPRLQQMEMQYGSTTAKKISSTISSIIYDQPEGEELNFYRYSMYYYPYQSGTSYYVYYYYVDGAADKGVLTDDGDIYLKNPFYAFQADTWLKITKNSDGSMECKLPQLIYEQDGEYYYAAKLTYDESSSWYVVNEDDPNIGFTWQDDSLIIDLDTEDLIGLVSADGDWTGYAEYALMENIQRDETISLPEGAEDKLEQYVIKYDLDDDYPDGDLITAYVDGTDFYLLGLNPNLPDAAVKGTIDGTTVTFPADQYLGIDEYNVCHTYFFSGYMGQYLYSGTYYSVYILDYDGVEFQYDADAKTLTCEDGYIIVNAGNWTTNDYTDMYIFVYHNPIAEPWEEKAGTPSDPWGLNYYFYSAYTMGYFDFILPKYDVDGYFMDPSKLYYNIYLDDEILEFYSDEYLSLSYIGMEDGDTDVPYDMYDYWNYDFQMSGTEHLLYYYVDGLEKLGVQLIYEGGGERRGSNIVFTDGTTQTDIKGFSQTDDSEAKSITFTDLSGRQIESPKSGLYIKTTLKADGSKETSKVIIK